MWLQPVIKDTISSTNSYIKENNLPCGSVVIAKKQTAGRGRRGNSWVSNVDGNIYMSVVYKPEVPPEKIPLMSFAAGMAVRNTLFSFGIDCGLKWPNDVVCGGKKICGIMSEFWNNMCITGIGINLKKVDIPYATSADELGFLLNFDEVIEILLKNLEFEFTHTEDLIERYTPHCVTLGKEILIDGISRATATGIAEDGGLITTIGRVSCGDVSVRGIYGYI
ncbi:MAG: biotin--[Clostridia bacterium]|nr:biotin--[acetyl-CoA-carboxylase] ligase [Clostridia bacterium]